VIQRAERLKINVVQFFSRNPRSFRRRQIKEEEIAAFLEERSSSSVEKVFLHLPYLVNLASPDRRIFRSSCRILQEDLMFADRIGADGVVTHIGSHKGKGIKYGLMRVIEALEEVFSRYLPGTVLLLENSSGGRFCVGGNLEEIVYIIGQKKYRDYVGVCLDTAHAYSYGYNIDNLKILDKISSLVGEKLKLIHINDSKASCNSRIDRHEHIGRGKIGVKGFKRFLSYASFRKIPLILETPKKDDLDDLRNLRVVRKLFGKARRS